MQMVQFVDENRTLLTERITCTAYLSRAFTPLFSDYPSPPTIGKRLFLII